MYRKTWTGNAAIILLALTNIAMWLVFTPINDGSRPEFNRQFTSEIISSTAMVLMAAALYLSTRPWYLESFFGGLDRMYHSHKNAALAALLLIVAHFLVMPLDVSDDSSGNPLGMVSFVGLLVLVLLAVAPRLPLIGSLTRFSYSKWLKTHKFIGLFFITGFLHALAVNSLVVSEPALLTFLQIMFAIGAVSYLYTEVISKFLSKRSQFVVDDIHRLNGTTVEIALKPQEDKPRFKAGQFAFVSFPGDKVLKEPHPFTVSSSPREGDIRFAIKASGDWTRHLNTHLEAGATARVSRCYGRFNYKDGGREQIWVAAGIGITPFISWIRDSDGDSRTQVDLFYSVRSEGDLLFADEIELAAHQDDCFRPHLRISAQERNFTAQQIAQACEGAISDKHIFMCGPIAMMDSMERQFKRLGVPGKNIHYEEFNFR